MDREGFIHRTDDPDERARLEEARATDAERIAARIERLEEAGVDSERALPAAELAGDVDELRKQLAERTAPQELGKAGSGPNGVDPATHPHNDRILAANGFSMVRERCMTVAGGVPPLPAIEAAIRYLKASRSQHAAQGGQRQTLDALDAELAQFEAIHKFGRALAAITERFEARARITPGAN